MRRKPKVAEESVDEALEDPEAEEDGFVRVIATRTKTTSIQPRGSFPSSSLKKSKRRSQRSPTRERPPDHAGAASPPSLPLVSLVVLARLAADARGVRREAAARGDSEAVHGGGMALELLLGGSGNDLSPARAGPRTPVRRLFACRRGDG